VWCWSWNCGLVWNTLKQGSTHNPKLHFGHLNLILVNTEPHIVLWTFKSYPGLLCVEYTQYHNPLPFWGQWSLFCTLSQLVEGVGLICGAHPLWTCEIESQKVENVYCQSTVHVCHFHVAMSLSSSILFLFKGVPKMSCTWHRTTRDLCSKCCTFTRV